MVDARSASATRTRSWATTRGARKAWASRRRRVRPPQAQAGHRAASPPNAAAEARFQLAEYQFEEFDKLKIGGTGKALENSFTAKSDGGEEGARRLRRGLQVQAPRVDAGRALPPGLRAGALRRHHHRDAGPPGREAAGRTRRWPPTRTCSRSRPRRWRTRRSRATPPRSSQARKNRISNEWTKKTLEALNRFRPKEYPVLKDPKPAIAVTDVARGLVNTVAGPDARRSEAPDAAEAPEGGGCEAPPRRRCLRRIAALRCRAAMLRSPRRRRGRSPPRPPATPEPEGGRGGRAGQGGAIPTCRHRQAAIDRGPSREAPAAATSDGAPEDASRPCVDRNPKPARPG